MQHRTCERRGCSEQQGEYGDTQRLVFAKCEHEKHLRTRNCRSIQTESRGFVGKVLFRGVKQNFTRQPVESGERGFIPRLTRKSNALTSDTIRSMNSK